LHDLSARSLNNDTDSTSYGGCEIARQRGSGTRNLNLQGWAVFSGSCVHTVKRDEIRPATGRVSWCDV
jgi:hypothetical protein